jgi:hypothetical protein
MRVTPPRRAAPRPGEVARVGRPDAAGLDDEVERDGATDGDRLAPELACLRVELHDVEAVADRPAGARHPHAALADRECAGLGAPLLAGAAARPVLGSIRLTVPSSALRTQTAPAPTATSAGPRPTRAGGPARRVRGSTR